MVVVGILGTTWTLQLTCMRDSGGGFVTCLRVVAELSMGSATKAYQ